MTLLLLVILLLLFCGVFSQNSNWGYAPSGSLGTILFILIILWLCGVI